MIVIGYLDCLEYYSYSPRQWNPDPATQITMKKKSSLTCKNIFVPLGYINNRSSVEPVDVHLVARV